MITLENLQVICPSAKTGRLALFLEPLNSAMDEFEINTCERQACFLAQVAHESGGFFYVQEIADGSRYEGRADLGNTSPGDGVKYKGRGLIQITGRSNYALCGDALGLDLIDDPGLLEDPINACRSAGWFWQAHHLSELADAGDMEKITKRINGGLTGYKDRLLYWERAKWVLCQS